MFQGLNYVSRAEVRYDDVYSNRKYQYRDRMINNNQMDIMELKSTMTKMKSSLKCLNSWFDLAEEQISKLKDRPIEIMQLDTEKKEKNS